MYVIKHYSKEETHYNECEIDTFMSIEKGQNGFDDMLAAGSITRLNSVMKIDKDNAVAFYGFINPINQECEMMPVYAGERVYVVNENGNTVITLK